MARPIVRAAARGFTLIEMIVVLGIIVVITAIVFSGESSFNRSFYLTNTAYDVALTVRQAQTFGVSSKAFGATQNAGYGILLDNASPTGYILFADIQGGGAQANCPVGTPGTPTAKPGNCLYDGSSEQVQQYALGSNFSISKFCIVTTGNQPACYTPGANPNQRLAIVFTRSNEGPAITTTGGSGTALADRACFAVSDPAGASRYVKVNHAGQISVTSSCDTSL